MSAAHSTADAGRELTIQEFNILGLFEANTRSIWLPHTVSRNNLVKAGYLEWVPSVFGGECDYAITAAGRAALAAKGAK